MASLPADLREGVAPVEAVGETGSREAAEGAGERPALGAAPACRAPAIVASDLDGTLLDGVKRIPEANRAALDELARRGIPFVPCTGRGPAGIVAEVLDLAATRFAISANGAVIQEVVRERDGSGRLGERLHVETVSKREALDLLDLVRTTRATFDVFADGRMLMEGRYLDHLFELPVPEQDHALMRSLRERSDVPSERIIESAREVERLSCFWGYEEDRDAIVSFVEARPQLAWASGDPHIIEVTSAAATKGSGLAWLCGHLGIDIAGAWAFGDSGNDVPMLERAGAGIALANATADAIAAADQVTRLTNDEGGLGAHLLGMLG